MAARPPGVPGEVARSPSLGASPLPRCPPALSSSLGGKQTPRRISPVAWALQETLAAGKPRSDDDRPCRQAMDGVMREGMRCEITAARSYRKRQLQRPTTSWAIALRHHCRLADSLDSRPNDSGFRSRNDCWSDMRRGCDNLTVTLRLSIVKSKNGVCCY